MVALLLSQTCLTSLSVARVTDNPAHDYFGADGIVWSSFFNERTPQSLYLIGDTVHLLWTRVGAGNRYNRSVDRGTTWDWCSGSDCLGVQVLNYGWESSILARESRVYAIAYCWNCSPSSYVPFNRSLDNGSTWDYPPSGYTVFAASEYGGGPRNLDSPVLEASVHPDTLLLVVDAYSWGIRVKRSWDGGNTWNPSGGIIVASPSYGGERHPQMAHNGGGKFFVCYTDYPYVMVTYSSDHGSTWATPVPVGTLTTNLYYNSCHVSASGNYVSVVWFDKRGSAINVFYRESVDGGISWRPTENITALTLPSDTAAGATVVNRRGIVYITWFEKSSRSGGNFEIFSTCKAGPDSAWYPIQRISYTSGRSIWPMVSYSAGFGYGIACWQDNTPGNYEIYCSRFLPIVGNDDLGTSERPKRGAKGVRITGRTVFIAVPYRLYDASGRLLSRGESGKVELEAGIYFLRLESGKVERLLIK
ncbi:MAG: hypothetical protein GXO39_07275 [Thermotogae bacterium]|nr:hypothetical protein [Thermotogota bacterium]